MLLLSRKLDEKIVIGDDIEITVLGIRENTVKLGINAPRDMLILRSELKETENQNKEALGKVDDSALSELIKTIKINKGDEK